MTGVEIEYLLGIYFTVVSLNRNGNTVVIDWVKLIAGVLLLVLAVAGKAFIG